MSAFEVSSGLFPDSLLFPLQDQTIEEFSRLRSEMPDNLIGAFPRSYSGRIRRLFSIDGLLKSFRSTKYVEEIEETDEEGAICVFLPNDEDFATLAIPYLKLLHNYQIFVVVSPICGYFFEKAFQDAEFGEELQIMELHFDLLLLEPYLFLVQAPHAFSRIRIKGDIEDLVACARTLTKIQVINGGIKKVYAFGQQANRVRKIIEEEKAQVGLSSSASTPLYDELIIMDRSVDLLTPLLKQASYNGLIDECLGNNCGFVSLPTDTEEFQRSEELLTDNDPAFAKMRTMKPDDAADFLTSTHKSIKTLMQPTEGLVQAKKFQERMDAGFQFVNEKPFYILNAKILSYIVNLRAQDEDASEIYKYDMKMITGQIEPPRVAEKNVLRDQNWTESMREFCLASICMDGVRPIPLSAFKIRLISRFGLDYLDDLIKLNDLGLLRQNGISSINLKTIIAAASTFIKNKSLKRSEISKLFNLCIDLENKAYEKDEKLLQADLDLFTGKIPAGMLPENVSDRLDIGGIYDGYVPLSARLVELCIRDGYAKQVDEQYQSKLRTSAVQNYLKEQLDIDDDNNDKANVTMPEEPGFFKDENIKRRVLVFVIGGVTNSEALVIREVGRSLFKGKIDITIGSTTILTSKDFIQEITPKLVD